MEESSERGVVDIGGQQSSGDGGGGIAEPAAMDRIPPDPDWPIEPG